MLNEPVAMIAPGKEMRAFYDSHIERNDREDLPTSHKVSLAYRDSSQRQYSETSVLDIEEMKGTMFASVQTLHDIGKTLEKMENTFNGASLLRRSGSVEVDASIETRGEQRQRLAEERAEFASATQPYNGAAPTRQLGGGTGRVRCLASGGREREIGTQPR